ncbi:MAG: TetR family transcriptional regulator [Candidatus Nanopelagicaceae bacterium]|nr:TetR family transcriptional regulator [Candidatus Nanopelagicaceae bacterium]
MSTNSARATYQHQSTIHRRTRSAIMDAARALLSESGISGTNMIEIADRAQVSRASLYNHFRDKGEVFVALVETELERISTLALVAQSRSEALYLISREISEHQGLQKALKTDGDIMANVLSASDHKIWVEIYSQLAKIFATDVVGVGLVLRWLMGQVTAPLSQEHSRQQADRLAAIL